jgi:hypothetical protein
MCEPATIGLALSIASSAAGFMAESAATNEQNAQISAENAAKAASDLRARQAANDEIAQAQDQARIENERIIADGFNKALEGRESEATSLTMAGSNGVQGISVDEAYWDIAGINYRNTLASESEMSQNLSQLESSVLGIKSDEAQRIEDNRPDAYKSGPSPVGAALSIAGAGNTYVEGQGGYSKVFGK